MPEDNVKRVVLIEPTMSPVIVNGVLRDEVIYPEPQYGLLHGAGGIHVLAYNHCLDNHLKEQLTVISGPKNIVNELISYPNVTLLETWQAAEDKMAELEATKQTVKIMEPSIIVEALKDSTILAAIKASGGDADKINALDYEHEELGLNYPTAQELTGITEDDYLVSL